MILRFGEEGKQKRQLVKFDMRSMIVVAMLAETEDVTDGDGQQRFTLTCSNEGLMSAVLLAGLKLEANEGLFATIEPVVKWMLYNATEDGDGFRKLLIPG